MTKAISFDFGAYVEGNRSALNRRLRGAPADETRRARRQRTRKTIARIAAVAREVLDIYSAVKRKDPISIALGALSAYGCVSELFEKPSPQAQEHLKSLGAVKVFPMMCSFIFHTLQQMDVPVKRVWSRAETSEEGEETKEGIEEFDLGGDVRVWFIDSGSDDKMEGPEHGPYVLDQAAFTARLSSVLEEKLGRVMAVNTIVKGWEDLYYLGPLRIPTALYVSHIDEDELMRRVFELQKLGFNRSALFFGPPGIGKTTLAAKLAERMDGRLLVASSGVLDSPRGRTVLEELTDLVDPAVLLLDDLDKMWRPGEMLESMERLNRKVGMRRRLIIGTVNTLSEIPEPLRRPGRFDEIVEFPPLTFEQRHDILAVYTREFGSSLTERQLERLAKASSDMTGAYLKEIAMRTKVVPFDLMCEHIAQMKRICNMVGEAEERGKVEKARKARESRRRKGGPKARPATPR